jgi:hypothetical protein
MGNIKTGTQTGIRLNSLRVDKNTLLYDALVPGTGSGNGIVAEC